MQFPTHNFALISKKTCSEKLIDFAQKNFASLAADYLLTPQKALPHITVCQVNTTDEDAKKIWDTIQEFECYPEFLEFMCFESSSAKDMFWCDFLVKKTPELLDLQKTVFESVRASKVQPLTLEAEEYRPHLTLARILAQQIYPNIEVPEFLTQTKNKFRLALCRSDAIGQVIEVLES